MLGEVLLVSHDELVLYFFHRIIVLRAEPGVDSRRHAAYDEITLQRVGKYLFERLQSTISV